MRRIILNEQGSFTVEASLLFPLLIILTMISLLFSLIFCRNALVAVTASLTADRAAYVWDNSAKDAATGAFPPEQRDPLYTSSFLNELTALMGERDQADAEWSLGNTSKPSEAPLGERKLGQEASLLPSAFHGQLAFENRLFLSRIRVQLSEPLRFTLPGGGIAQSSGAAASAYVVAPEELIRSVQLLMDYAARIRDYLHRPSGDEAGQADLPPSSTQGEEPPAISSEAEAKAYIRKLVNGGGTHFDTVIDHYREIDAIDPDGVAHEAKYTVNQADAMRQIAKDHELMQNGVVKGVVWHFFPYRKTGKVQLTESLREKLEQNGIIVIVHQD